MIATSRPRLQPMGLGDLLDTTFALYRDNFILFAGIVAVLQIPESVLLAVISAFGRNSSAVSTSTSLGVTALTATDSTALALGGGLIGIVIGAFTLVMMAALARAISTRYLGEPITIGQAYRSVGISTVLSLFVAGIIFAVLVGIAFVVLILPAIYIGVRFSLFAQVAVLERTGPWTALKRSWSLVGGSWWRVFGIEIVIILLAAILESIVGGLAGGIFSSALGPPVGPILGVIFSAIATILVQPIQFGGLTLLYYDLRIRKEGFDVQHMVEALGSQPAL